jgi:hypothetical protein
MWLGYAFGGRGPHAGTSTQEVFHVVRIHLERHPYRGVRRWTEMDERELLGECG